MNTLQILSKDIRQVDGLYCLNDLHKAAGGEARHRPSRFIRLSQTQELIKEIERYPNKGNGNQTGEERYPNMGNGNQTGEKRSPNMASANNNDSNRRPYLASAIKTEQRGKFQGTYVSPEVVISYGAWISAKINLAVIRGFLDQQEQAIDQKLLETTEPTAPPELTSAQQRHIQKRVKQLVKQQIGTSYSGMWGSIKDKFKVPTYSKIKAHQYPALCEFLRCEPIKEELDACIYVPEGSVLLKKEVLDDLLIKITRMNAGVSVIDKMYAHIVEATNELLLSPPDNRIIN